MIPPELISAAIDICTIVSALQTTRRGQETNLKAYYQTIDGWAVEIIRVGACSAFLLFSINYT